MFKITEDDKYETGNTDTEDNDTESNNDYLNDINETFNNDNEVIEIAIKR